MTGRLSNWSKDEYEADSERERATRLKTIVSEPQGPRAYYDMYVARIVSQEDKPQFVMGRLFDELLLEDRIGWFQSDVTRNEKHAKYQDVLDEADGKPVLNTREVNQLMEWRDGVLRNKRFREFIEGPRFRQQVVLWEEEIDGIVIPCKAAFDLWSATSVADLKTTIANGVEEYKREFDKYWYDFQGAFYLRGRAAIPELSEIRCEFWHLVVSKNPPYRAYAWQVHPSWLASGRRSVESALRTLARCRKRQAEIEAAGGDVQEAWPDLCENEVLVADEWMLSRRGIDPNDFDPSGAI